MPDQTVDAILQKSAVAGLLKNITLVGGEPFIEPGRLLGIIRKIWQTGAGTLEVFIPTNARWIAEPHYEDWTRQLLALAQWFPYGLRIAFSKNEWNLAQLGALAPLVQERWADLEQRYPETFFHRTLTREELLPLGRASSGGLAAPAGHVGVNCNFDDWHDPGLQGGFCTDYLAFYPNGECGLCYVYHSPAIGTIEDSFAVLLSRRREYLLALRRHITGENFGVLYPDACLICRDFYPRWLHEQGI